MKIYLWKNICFLLSLVGASFFFVVFVFVTAAPNQIEFPIRILRIGENTTAADSNKFSSGISSKLKTSNRNTQNTFALADMIDDEENTRYLPHKKIPLKLLKQLQEVRTIDELFEQLVEPGQRYRRRGLKSTSISAKKVGRRHRKSGKAPRRNVTEDDTILNDGGESESAAAPSEIDPIFDKRAFCHPRRVPVKVPQPSDPAIIYQPMCIQIERCGGCCAHELFECVPSVTKNATRKVVALRYPHAGAQYFVYEAEAKVRVERHTKCKCQCKIQPQDCSEFQHYEKQSCKCTCPQDSSQTSCKSPQVWSNQECRCRCPEYLECSTGTYFDTRSCRCRSAGEIVALSKLYRSNPVKGYF